MKSSGVASSSDVESGFTLIELLVYLLFAVVILTIVGGLLINSMQTERSVRSTADATNTGQLIARSVQAGVRNASKVKLVDNAGTQLLTVRTAGMRTPVEWSCQAWYFTPDAGGTLWSKTVTPAAAIAAPTTSTPAGWSKLAEGVRVGGGPVFAAVPGLVSMDLRVSAGDQAAVNFVSRSTSRNLESIGAPCF